MYAVQNNASTASLAGVQVEAVSGERRVSQLLTANLEDKLNPSGAVPARAPYRLASSVVVSSGAIGVARDGTISRYNVYLDSTYTLYSNADNSVLTTGTLRHVSSYNNLSNQYFSTYVSEQDAIKRGLTELAEVYKQRLSPFLAVKQ